MVTVKPIPKPKQQLLKSPQPDAMFQAIGVLYADVELDEGKATVVIGGKPYRLGYVMQNQGDSLFRLGGDFINRSTFQALKRRVSETGKRQRLIVYPRVIHLPGRNTPSQLSFNLLGFEGKKPLENSVFKKLQDFEFRLCGLWQYIPVCLTPVVTVLKNSSEDRRILIKELSATDRLRHLKASHIPVRWDNPVIKPFKYNPRLDKEKQGQPSFVQLITTFSPENDTFSFSALLNIPSENAPRFLKISNKDKSEALGKQVK
jgi:hypothetical protein